MAAPTAFASKMGPTVHTSWRDLGAVVPGALQESNF